MRISVFSSDVCSSDLLPYFQAFSFFRLAAICQGVYARGLAGNASSLYALDVGAKEPRLAEHGWAPARGDRNGAVLGTRVSERVDHGASRIIHYHNAITSIQYLSMITIIFSLFV